MQIGDYKNAFYDTWKNKRNVCWPKEWLGVKDFPKARILSVSYDSRAFKGGKEELREIVTTLLNNLISHANVGKGWPVVLVGHSLGGLIIKHLCCEANHLDTRSEDFDPHRAFLENTLGAFFYATPHGGAPLVDTVKRIDIFKKAAPVLQHLARDNIQLTSLTEDFIRVRRNWNWKTSGLGEVLPVHLGPFNEVIVPKASARAFNCDEYATVPTADHFSICKPDGDTHLSYCELKKFIGARLKEDSRAPIDRPHKAVRGLYLREKQEEALLYLLNEFKTAKSKSRKQEIGRQLLEAGVMPALMRSLESNNTGIKKDAVWALENIAYRSELEEMKSAAAREGAVQALVRMLEANEATMVLPVVFCLRVLISNNDECHRKLMECWSTAEPLLKSAMKIPPPDESIDPESKKTMIEIARAADTVLKSVRYHNLGAAAQSLTHI